MSLTAIGERAAVAAMRFAPKQLYSTAVGWGARRTIPRLLRAPIYATFSRAVGVDLNEVELPLAAYPTFGSFFGRRLRTGAREASVDMTAAASPSDGVVGAVGAIERQTMLQAKGHDYRVGDLLADDVEGQRFEGGTQLTIYLSPADYHRIHAPVSCRFVGYRYVPGQRYPVSAAFASHRDGLFARNERLILELETDDGPIALVLVGALGVGNMRLAAPAIETRAFRGQKLARHVQFDEPLRIARGQELAAFELGSTVILAFSRGMFSVAGLAVEQRLRCGEPIGRLNPSITRMVQ